MLVAKNVGVHCQRPASHAESMCCGMQMRVRLMNPQGFGMTRGRDTMPETDLWRISNEGGGCRVLWESSTRSRSREERMSSDECLSLVAQLVEGKWEGSFMSEAVSSPVK